MEYVASYFDDLALTSGGSYSERVQEGLLSEQVADFHTRFDAYVACGRWDPEGILADPKWLEVVDAARSAQARLLALLDDDAEKVALTKRSPHAISAAS